MAGLIDIGYAAKTAYNSMPESSVSGRERAGGSFSDAMAEKYSLSARNMTLTEYKMYFDGKMSALYTHPSQKHVSWLIDITDAAYLRMQTDPAYERQILNYLAWNKAADVSGRAPRFVYVHIGDTWEKCYGYAFRQQDDSRAKRAAERRRLAAERAKKARRKRLLKEYLQKKAEDKRLQGRRLQDRLLRENSSKRWLEHVRLTAEWSRREEAAAFRTEQSMAKRQEQARIISDWNEARQMVQAFYAYEASLVMMSRCGEQMLL